MILPTTFKPSFQSLQPLEPNSQCLAWVQQIFPQAWMLKAENIGPYIADFMSFKEYLEAKGNYQPNVQFLNYVFDAIIKWEFSQLGTNEKEIHSALQNTENMMFYTSGDARKFVNQCAKSVAKHP